MTQQKLQTMQPEYDETASQQPPARDTDRRGAVESEDRDFMLANLLLNGNEQRGGFGRRKEDVDKWVH